jgi:hypothetical protein
LDYVILSFFLSIIITPKSVFKNKKYAALPFPLTQRHILVVPVLSYYVVRESAKFAFHEAAQMLAIHRGGVVDVVVDLRFFWRTPNLI